MIQNVFCDCAVIEIGCRLYIDSTGEVPAAAGKYSDGTNCYNVDSFGYVTSVNLCGS
jgi:hypothetical protein